MFSARYQWLKDQLRFDAASLPEHRCDARDGWYAALNPQRAWVVFPSAYFNSPASMFGHTLLRIDGAAGSDDAPLLAYAVNFAAQTAETNGLLFAVMGLAGGYSGSFSVLPYYEKVREYARLEARDLWEYPLSLTADEIRMLMLHLWELRGAEFDYYFFTKNCSYQLLTLIQAARPAFDAAAEYEWWAIPTDTIRFIERQPGLVGAPAYRPSLVTLLGEHAATLDAPRQDLALALARGEAPPAQIEMPDVRTRARVLDVAHDWLFLRFQEGGVSRAEALPRTRELLRARAATGARSEFPEVPAPAVSPIHGHATRRAAVGAFADEDREGVVLRLRPAYHDLLDAPDGYGDGQQINFMDGTLAYDDEARRLRFVDARVVDIVSIAPRDRLFQPVSWRVAFGARRLQGLATPVGGFLDGGPGLTYEPAPNWLAYGFALAAFEANADLDAGQSFGAGGMLGVLARLAPGWQLQLDLASLGDVSGAELDRRWVRLGQHWRMTNAWGVRLDAAHERKPAERDVVELSLHRYF